MFSHGRKNEISKMKQPIVAGDTLIPELVSVLDGIWFIGKMLESMRKCSHGEKSHHLFV